MTIIPRILGTAAILLASIVSGATSNNAFESIPSPTNSTLADLIPLVQHSLTYSTNKTLSYVEAGPSAGPLLIFIHGFPATALTWTSQLTSFASMGFHVVAPDMPGYGQSSFDHVYSDYSIPSTVNAVFALLACLNSTSAVWIGHDWGNGPISGLLTHHPSVVRAATLMAVPYHTLDLGLEEGLKTINRTVYPEQRYPYGQWSYQVYYEQSFDNATTWFNKDIPGALKAFYAKGDPSTFRKPAFTADVVRDGGWFGGRPRPPTVDETPEDATVLKEPLRSLVTSAFEETGFWAANAWYMNHKTNRAYTLGWVNGGVLEMPVLFIEAKFDQVCDTANSEFALAMLQNTKDLTYLSIEAGHWVQMEQPEQTTAAITKWLTTKVPVWWPYTPEWKTKEGNLLLSCTLQLLFAALGVVAYNLPHSNAPGVVFRLTPNYGMAAIYTKDGASVPVAQVQGSSEYQAFMRKTTALPNSPHNTACQLLSPIVDMLPSTPMFDTDLCPHPDVFSVKPLLAALKTAVESYVGTNICFAALSIEESKDHKARVAQKALRAVGLRQVLGTILLAKSVIYGNLPNELPRFDQESWIVLAVDYSTHWFMAGLYTIDEGLVDPIDGFVDDTVTGEKEPLEALEHALKRLIVGQSEIPNLRKLVRRLYVYGDNGHDPALHQLLATILDQDLVRDAYVSNSTYEGMKFLAQEMYGSMQEPLFLVGVPAAFGCRWRSKLHHSGHHEL